MMWLIINAMSSSIPLFGTGLWVDFIYIDFYPNHTAYEVYWTFMHNCPS